MPGIIFGARIGVRLSLYTLAAVPRSPRIRFPDIVYHVPSRGEMSASAVSNTRLLRRVRFRPVEMLVEEVVGSLAMDRVWTDEPFDFGAVADVQ